MDFVVSVLDYFMQMTFFGKLLSVIIVMFFVCGFGLALGKSAWIKRVKKDIDIWADSDSRLRESIDDKQDAGETPTDLMSKKTGCAVHSDFVSVIVHDYTLLMEQNPDAVDLETLIQTGIPGWIHVFNRLIRLLPGTLVSLGLLGTFIGLASAISNLISEFSLQSILSHANDDIAAFTSFMDVIRAPLASMGTAFGTSILGLLSSVLFNLIVAGLGSNREDEVIDQFYDYLANGIGVKYENKIDRAILLLRDSLQSSITDFTFSVKTLSLDLGTSVESINQSVNGLNQAIQQIRDPIEVFHQSVADFNQSCSVLDHQVSEINQITLKLSDEINMNMKSGLDNFVLRMDQVTSSFSDRIDSAAITLKDSMLSGVSSFIKVLEKVESNLVASEQAQEKTKQTIETLNITHEKYLASVEKIESYLDSTKHVLIETEITLRNISNSIVKNIADSFTDVAQQTSTHTAEFLSSQMHVILNETHQSMIQVQDGLKIAHEEARQSISILDSRMATLLDSIKSGHLTLNQEIIAQLSGMQQRIESSTDTFNSVIQGFNELAMNLVQTVNQMSVNQVEVSS